MNPSVAWGEVHVRVVSTMGCRLSVNINKIATLRNSRGGAEPDLGTAVATIVDAGAKSITVHPRADERHIRAVDVAILAQRLRSDFPDVEYNIEGDPSEAWVELVRTHRPTQCTLVPVIAGEITSQAGWPPNTPKERLRAIIADFCKLGIRVSVFVDPEIEAIEWVKSLGADRVELYTEPYARACERGEQSAALRRYQQAAEHGRKLGLGINAGHDLNLDNLTAFVRACRPDEVSIGHALISRALYVGLATAVKEYLSLTENV